MPIRPSAVERCTEPQPAAEPQPARSVPVNLACGALERHYAASTCHASHGGVPVRQPSCDVAVEPQSAAAEPQSAAAEPQPAGSASASLRSDGPVVSTTAGPMASSALTGPTGAQSQDELSRMHAHASYMPSVHAAHAVNGMSVAPCGLRSNAMATPLPGAACMAACNMTWHASVGDADKMSHWQLSDTKVCGGAMATRGSAEHCPHACRQVTGALEQRNAASTDRVTHGGVPVRQLAHVHAAESRSVAEMQLAAEPRSAAEPRPAAKAQSAVTR